jgi:steroid 5-alpha reductase family enzyme
MLADALTAFSMVISVRSDQTAATLDLKAGLKVILCLLMPKAFTQSAKWDFSPGPRWKWRLVKAGLSRLPWKAGYSNTEKMVPCSKL